MLSIDVCCVKSINQENKVMVVNLRESFSEEQKLQISCSVFGSAVCSSADCSHSAVCHIHSRETTAHIQE